MYNVVVDNTGAAMFALMVNPYDPGMTREEKLETWEKWRRRRKLMYFLARRFPRFLKFFYRRTFLSGKHGPVDKWLSSSLSEQVSLFSFFTILRRTYCCQLGINISSLDMTILIIAG